MDSSTRKRTYSTNTPCASAWLASILISLLASSYSFCAEGEPSTATVGVVSINEPFTATGLQTVRRRIEALTEANVQAILFEFSGSGRSYDSFSDLGRMIAKLPEQHGIRTIAFVPEDSLGMTMLGILACQEIHADAFAQLGKVYPLPAAEAAPQRFDRQQLVHLLGSLAEAAGHDPLTARAMADEKIILYRIQRDGQTKLVDQRGFEQYTQHNEMPWQMAGDGPLVGPTESLLLSGREALEIGLVKSLAADRDELIADLGLTAVDPTTGSEKQTDQPEISLHSPPAESTSIVSDPNQKKENKVAVIVCDGMIDEGLYESIKRRTEVALADGATYIVYEIDTFGGLLHSAISIWDYFMHDVGSRAHTVAYVPTKAISAGALISVACNDIIMKESTLIGDCAPISPGTTLEGTEREKVESPTRTYFTTAAEKNGYPVALCTAMVTIDLKVYQVKNLQTGEFEYFEENELPSDPYANDLEGKKVVVKEDELLTVHADKALEYGLCRAVVKDRDEALAFLEKRDGVTFTGSPTIMTTNWSEELVRWLTSPTIAGILLMIGLLGAYVELNTPGLGLPGLIAVIALGILFGSKFLIGLANWWEIALFFIGLGLFMVEIFLIPGFGIFGISGMLFIVIALLAMLIGNPPDKLPIPVTPMDWENVQRQFLGMMGGIGGFIAAAMLLSKYLPKIPFANRLILLGPPEIARPLPNPPAMSAMLDNQPEIKVGQTGIAVTPLRPAGTARFKNQRMDVVSRSNLIDKNTPVRVVEVEGNRIVVVADEENKT